MASKNDPTAIYFSAGVLVLSSLLFVVLIFFTHGFWMIQTLNGFIASGCLLSALKLIKRKGSPFLFSVIFLGISLVGVFIYGICLWQNEWVENQLGGLLFFGLSILYLPAILLLFKQGVK